MRGLIGNHGQTLRLGVMVAATLLALPLVVELAAAADARDVGDGEVEGQELVVGIAVVVVYLVAGVLVLVRPGLAALLFLLAAALGFFVGRNDGTGGLAVYGGLALLLAAAAVLPEVRRVSAGVRGDQDARSRKEQFTRDRS